MRLAISVAVAVTAFTSPALAFHASETFGTDASAGGGSGIYYTGSPRSKNWTCEACHLDAPHQVGLQVVSDPAELFAASTYTPGQTYSITVSLVGETKGLEASANYNTVAVEVLDGERAGVGGFFGFDENLMRTEAGGSYLFAQGQKNLDVSAWAFRWQAPDAGRGYVDFHLIAVDGNGADVADTAASDPLGDDVARGVLRIAEQGVPLPPPEGPIAGGCRSIPSSSPGLWIICGLGLFAFVRSR